MSTPLNPASGSVMEPAPAPATVASPTRPLYWLVRRELWENRSAIIAPIAVAAVLLLGTLISTFTLPARLDSVRGLGAVKQHETLTMPFYVIAGLVMATVFLVGVFYCLEALHGERRDRSILFWKSLPVSDRATVLSKVVLPLVVLPLLALALIATAQLILLIVSTAMLVGSPGGISRLWSAFPYPQMLVALIYALTAIALWHAPIYAWLLLISVWAPRAAFLWAVLPILASMVVEVIVLNSSRFAMLMKYRLIGWFTSAFDTTVPDTAATEPLGSLTPWTFLTTPGLWLGLIFAAVILTLAVRLRRNREPI